MTPLDSQQRASIAKRLSFLEVELGDLDGYAGLEERTYRSDRKVRREVERLAENLVNAYVDVSKIVLAGEDVEIPPTYRDALLVLGERGLLESGTASVLADFVRLRNVLAHQDLDIRWSVLADFLKRGPSHIRGFIEDVQTLLQAGRA